MKVPNIRITVRACLVGGYRRTLIGFDIGIGSWINSCLVSSVRFSQGSLRDVYWDHRLRHTASLLKVLLVPKWTTVLFALCKKKSKSDGSDSGEENLSKKELALKQAIDQINTSHGKDIALGVGGFPKTPLALHVIAEAQKQGGYCVFVDAEHALDPSLAEAIGVNTRDLLLSQPDCGEQALRSFDNHIRIGSVDCCCMESVAALVPKSELDGEMGDAHMAMQARLMSQALRKLSHSLSTSQTILIFINQHTSDSACGGNALKFYASIRLNIRRIGLVKKGDETLGSQVLVKIMKNKLAPPYRTAQFELEFGKGICRESELIELGIKHKFILKAGGAYYSMGEMKFCGKDAIKRYLADNLTIREELETKLREKLVDEPRREKDLDTTDTEDVIAVDGIDEEVTALEA
ncbi:DNA repair protein RecA homolog 3, mitochondrial [Tanacetum coccineum]